MNDTQWSAIDDYFCDVLHLSDPVLEHALNCARNAGLPSHEVAPNQGRLLQIFARMVRAERILEIGTLGGYSTIWLARALPASGKLISLEQDPANAEVARANLAAAGLAACTDVIVGDARDTLQQLLALHSAPFDMIFIDADKRDNPHYLELALRLSRNGTIIVADNIIRGGRIVDPEATHQADVQGVCRFLEMSGHDLRVTATAIQTVGAKGWDGFSLALVSR